MQEATVTIPNAPHWLNNSCVIIKEDYTAADESWVTARMVKFGVQGTGTKATPDMQMGTKERGVLQVERMVLPGSVVAVQRRNGRVKTVNLPQEADQLLLPDLNYIINQIDECNTIMSPEEQETFLPSANGLSGESLQIVK